MDIKKPPKQKTSRLDAKQKNRQSRSKPDKLIWVLGCIAFLVLVFLGAIVIFNVTRPQSKISKQATQFVNCPDANKQHPGHCISSNAATLNLEPQSGLKYQFTVLDSHNKPIKEFDTVHEKKLHMIVVRKDLTDFQHLHPTFDQQTGIWTLDSLLLPNNGPYRIFADFTPTDAQQDAKGVKAPVTIYEDISVGDQSKFQAQKIGDTTSSKNFDDYEVLLQTKPMVVAAGATTTLEYLFLDTTKSGDQAVTDFEPYLGSIGHAIVLSENLDFIHAHAMDDPKLNQRGIVDFMFTPSKQGKYKIFAQFKRQGKVFTTDFVLPVYKDLAPGDVQLNSGNDAHSGHGM